MLWDGTTLCSEGPHQLFSGLRLSPFHLLQSVLVIGQIAEEKVEAHLETREFFKIPQQALACGFLHFPSCLCYHSGSGVESLVSRREKVQHKYASVICRLGSVKVSETEIWSSTLTLEPPENTEGTPARSSLQPREVHALDCNTRISIRGYCGKYDENRACARHITGLSVYGRRNSLFGEVRPARAVPLPTAAWTCWVGTLWFFTRGLQGHLDGEWGGGLKNFLGQGLLGAHSPTRLP